MYGSGGAGNGFIHESSAEIVGAGLKALHRTLYPQFRP